MFYFHPENWGRFPFWRAYFSAGLKPSTSSDDDDDDDDDGDDDDDDDNGDNLMMHLLMEDLVKIRDTFIYVYQLVVPNLSLANPPKEIDD